MLIEDDICTVKRFKIKNKIYHCISTITDLLSKDINEVIETKSAKLNNEYNNIVLSLKEKLKK